MFKKLNLINLLVIILIFPMIALMLKDYLVYRYSQRVASSIKVLSPPPARQPAIQEYAPVIESQAFPSRVHTLTALVLDDPGAKTADPSSILSELRLNGVFLGSKSLAVIEKNGEGEKVFKPGDNVFEKGILKEIKKDSAVILSGAREITFKMPNKEPPADTSPRNTAPGNTPRDANARLVSSEKTGEHEWTLDHKAILNAINNIGQVMTDARLTPLESNGVIQGFTVAEIKPNGIFDAIGLKNGDVLSRVNGYEIVSPERAVQVLSALKGEKKINLDVIRGGQRLSFHYEIR